MKPLFSDKSSSNQINTIVINDKIITEDGEIAQNMNNYFADSVTNLDIQENRFLLKEISNICDPIDAIIKKYDIHPSILKIREKVHFSKFSLSEVSSHEIEKHLQFLDPKKSTTYNNIPSRYLKDNLDICGNIITKLVNDCIKDCDFPNRLKLADITPIHKCGETMCHKNYRPVSILPALSKIYERVMQNQINNFIAKYLSPFMCGYRKGYNPQHALLTLIEKWKRSLDRGAYSGVIFMDLSKAFETINHDLLIAKLNAYGFTKSALKLMKSYLSNRWQRTKINTSFSTWREVDCGVPQGSVLGPLLFNVYVNDLFWVGEQTESCGWADDISVHACDISLESLILRLEHDSLLVMEWFDSNCMKLNAEKCHLLLTGHKPQWKWAMVGKEKIWESKSEKLLGIIIDKDLKFNEHVRSLCLKAGRKVTALGRICRYISLNKRKTLFNAFIQSQFAYCPLVWIFHGRDTENKIRRLHERVLRIVYSDYDSTFEELLLKDDSVTFHIRNIQLLAIELYKSKNGLSPQIINALFEKKYINGKYLFGIVLKSCYICT